MANNTFKISNSSACTLPKSTDLVLIASANNANASKYDTRHTSVTQLVSNLDKVIITKTTTPANNSANAAGVSLHQFWFDTNYMYVVVSNTEIKRVALSSF